MYYYFILIIHLLDPGWSLIIFSFYSQYYKPIQNNPWLSSETWIYIKREENKGMKLVYEVDQCSKTILYSSPIILVTYAQGKLEYAQGKQATSNKGMNFVYDFIPCAFLFLNSRF